MAFEIDTGTEFDPLIDGIQPWLRDMLPDDAPRAQIIRAQVEQLVGEIHQPVKTETIRNRVSARWSFLTALMREHPEQFDWVMTEYTDAIWRRR